MKQIIPKIITMIEQHDKIAIFHHNNIDGDSLSCSYGLLLALQKKWPNKKFVWIVNQEEMAKNFNFFSYDQKVVAQTIDDSYLAIIGDTSAKAQIFKYEELIKAQSVICFDHHQNDINIKADLFWSEPDYPASALQAIEIIKALKITYDENIAFSLMIGLITDTGNFTYSLNNPKPPQYFAELLTYISAAKMDYWWNSFRKKTQKDIELTKVFYQNLHFEGKVAYVNFNHELFQKFADINFKIQIGLIANIENYPIWALFVDEGQEIKLHFRSNGPNVAKIAIAYGGGGHLRAAGARVEKKPNLITEVLQKLNQAI